MKLLAVLSALVAVSTVSVAAPGSTASQSQPMQDKATEPAVKEIRISAIPDSDAKKVEEKCNLVAERLSKALGVPVKFMPQQNYLACVTGLATDQLELVWYGGVTACQAMAAFEKEKKECTFIACRDADKKYKTYFIANKESKIGTVKDLKELAAKCEGMNFTFGAKNSTSGHVMPRHFFEEQAGEKPQDVFKAVAYSNSHDQTIRDVAAGKAQVGALNFKSWDTAKAEDLAKAKEKCEIVYTTPDYVDYVWVARNGVGADILKKMKDFFTGLDPSKEEDNKILEAWGIKGGKFVDCEKKEWDGIKKVLEAGVDVG